MNRENDNQTISGKDDNSLLSFWSQRIHSEQSLPEANQFLYSVSQTSDDPETQSGEEDMLDLVLEDALAGVDIAAQYPNFFEKMVANPALSQSFLDVLHLLESERAGTLQPLPSPASRDLSFLQTAVFPSPLVQQIAHRWQITWDLLRSHLQSRLNPDPTLAFRRGDSFLDDEEVTLLRSDFELDDAHLEAALEAARPLEQPDVLHLHLSVAAFTGTAPDHMKAHLQWGAYQETAVLDAYGQATFPPLPLESVLDADTEQFRADLQLTLES